MTRSKIVGGSLVSRSSSDRSEATTESGSLILLSSAAPAVFAVVSVLVGLYFRTKCFACEIDAWSAFRQAHVASNIIYFVRDGVSITTEMFTKNMAYKVFDFPLYQQLVAVICRYFGTDILLTGRGINLAIYVASYLTLYRLMRHFEIRTSTVLIVLFCYSVSPLNIYYNRALIPDNLAILFSFLSLLLFVCWDGGGKEYDYVGLLITGIMATLIKNPIYLPIPVAIIVFYASHRNWKRLFSLRLLFYGGTLAATVIVFKLYTNYVNAGMFRTPAWEFQWYFSDLIGRFDWRSYDILVKRLIGEISLPIFVALLPLGFSLYLNTTAGSEYRRLPVGLLIGSASTVLLFFNVNVVHDYYQLPYVFIVSFFVGYCIDWIRIKSSFFVGTKPSSRRWRLFDWSIIAFLVALSVVATRVYALPISVPPDRAAAGALIRAHTPEDAFVVYVIDEADWDPSYLYYARREGYNLAVEEFRPQYLLDITSRFATEGQPVYLYVPSNLRLRLTNQIENSTWKTVVENNTGQLLAAP